MESGRFGSSLREVCEEWTLDDLQDAHFLLDAFQKAEANAARAAQKTR